MKSYVKNISRDKVLLILDWCITKFGQSEFNKGYPKLRVYKTKGMSNYYKEPIRGIHYPDNNIICIYLGAITSVKILCETVIHEYKHYLLDNDEYEALIKILKKKNYDKNTIYDKHPHERKARRSENYWGKICYSELKYKLYKK